MSELPADGAPGVAGAARDAARGHVVYLTERGERLAANRPHLDGDRRTSSRQERMLILELASTDGYREK
ncbi:MAG: hypothetical protein M3Y33_03540 [Actinomycetota bacterium]|nr:hypothetical protein [Actinomycetota bacterium]